MAFGTTSVHVKKPAVLATAPKAGPAPSRTNRPRRGKVGGLWGRWQTEVGSLGLTPSQQRFADAFFHGDNVMMAGAAGTGKSYLTRALVEFLKDARVNVGITASTGVAAFNIGGQTLHSFCGLGLADEPAEQLIAKVIKNRKVKDRLKAIDVLFLDEVSMVKGDLLSKVDAVLRAVRHNRAPFGGVQMAYIGDPLQLQPVFKGGEMQELFFQCQSWIESDVQTVVLTEQMRQQADPVLLKVLGDIRVGRTDSLHLLDPRIDATFPQDGVEPVRIFCKNVDVDLHNAERLRMLTTPPRTFVAHDIGLPYHTDAFNRNCPAPQVLELKPGALVTLLSNVDVDLGLCNGSVGVVQSFVGDGVKVKFLKTSALITRNEWQIKEQEVGMDGKMMSKVKATRSQIPLKLAWASTTHRAQGQTLDRAVLDMSEAFGAGMIYTALSRVRDLGSLSIIGGIPSRAVKVNPECVAFYQAAEQGLAVPESDAACRF